MSNRIIDLVRDACGQLANCRHFLVHHQLRLGGAQIGHRLLQLGSALGHLGIERIAPTLERFGLSLQAVEQLVEMRRHHPQLVLRFHLDSPGSASEDSPTTRKVPARIGATLFTPPKSAMYFDPRRLIRKPAMNSRPAVVNPWLTM